MATYYYGINKGQNEYEAVSNTSTNTKNVEIAIDNAVVTDRETALLLIENLKNFILRSLWPLA